MRKMLNRREDWFEGIDLWSTPPSPRQHLTLRRFAAILVALFLFFAGCAKDSRVHELCVTTGICDPVPPPARLVEVPCDSSALSSCNATTLRAAADALLPSLALAPKSVLRIWMFGEELTDIRPVVTLTVPPPATGGAAAARAAQKRWIEHARGVIDAASNEMFSRAELRKSRIAEAIGEIARADNPDHLPRIIVYIGDRLEESKLAGHFECQPPPKPEDFAQRLFDAGVLHPDSLTGVHVIFAYGNASRHRCPSLARDTAIQAIWSTVITKSGGTPEFYQEGLPLDRKE